jgi:hypothetical protein
MTGPDFLRVAIESGLSEHKERRAASIKAFLRHQFEIDAEVKFKQIELENKLLDLFIDVPMSVRDGDASAKLNRSRRSLFVHRYHREHAADPEHDPSDFVINERRWARSLDRDDSLGGASMLLDPTLQDAFEHFVIEGAPGQGKSTIAQYVCQVYRMKLLEQDGLFASLPSEHRTTQLRLPIRVDLRHFATWLTKHNPFSSDPTEQPPEGWHKSMESFIAALIAHQSGGTLFSFDDLLAVAQISAIFLVFDGLDEVADISTRREVVDEIVKGTQRLRENSASLQAGVTSRPAAFANSPGMPADKYAYFKLLDLKEPLILQYAERWIAAKRLDSRLGAEFRAILRERLKQPHLRDLARNPMQLAILLAGR